MAFEKIVLVIPTLPVLIVLGLVNLVAIVVLEKHVYHQRCFTKALENIHARLKKGGWPVVDITKRGVRRVGMSRLLVWSLFLLNAMVYGDLICCPECLRGVAK